MHVFGLLYAAVLAVVVLPLLPFVAVVWLASWLVDAAGAFRGRDGSSDAASARPGRRPARRA